MPSGSPRVWLITGCDKGLGRAIAEAALRKGDHVAATVLARDGRSSLTDTYGERCRAYHLDVTDRRAVGTVVADVQQTFGTIGVLVNNAGYGLVGAAEETGPEEYRPLFEVNFFGMAELTRAVLPGMRRQRSGHIINISSLVGFVGYAGFSFYAASKFAIEGFSESLAKEVRPLGVHVTIVEPGGFRSDFAGASLARASAVIGDYSVSSGATREYLTSRHGTQPGDPARLGAALCRIVDLSDPPLRLPLGGDALQQVSEKVAFAAAEMERWREISLSTSFDSSDVADQR
jgi:NAD(P)-dependent dehydrogenase (short-subunit alcohol dehydrogenase family)